MRSRETRNKVNTYNKKCCEEYKKTVWPSSIPGQFLGFPGNYPLSVKHGRLGIWNTRIFIHTVCFFLLLLISCVCTSHLLYHQCLLKLILLTLKNKTNIKRKQASNVIFKLSALKIYSYSFLNYEKQYLKHFLVCIHANNLVLKWRKQ